MTWRGRPIVNSDVWVGGGSTGNTFYHNSFDSRSMIHAENEGNIWDDGYPSGGNFWKDYDDADVKNGTDQDQPGGDGIGDIPIDISNTTDRDRYPLMYPYGTPPPPAYTLTISSASNGATDPAPGNYTYHEGQNVPVEALPNTGYILDHWELDGVNVGATSLISVAMSTDHVLHSIFSWIGVSELTITTTTGGTTSPSPGTVIYTKGTTVTVNALPDTGHIFDHWELDDANLTSNPINITLDTNQTLHAVFTPTCALTITTTTGGTTNPPPGTYTYHTGTVVSVTAVPNTDYDYYFDCWELDGAKIGYISLNPLVIDMDANHTLHVAFAQLSPGHDVAVKSISSRTVVGQGYASNITALTMNVGSCTETYNVTVYVDEMPVASQNVTLLSGAFTIIAFTWNTTGFAKGNYSISASADIVLTETNLTDNTLTDGWITIAMIGDITGLDSWPDGKVDIRDIALVASHFGQDSPPAPPNCDLTGPTTGVSDGKIDIRDISTVALNFGEVDP